MRRQKYDSAREAVDDLHQNYHGLLNPKNLIAYERGNSELDWIFIKKLAGMYNVSEEYLHEDDGVCWREANMKYGQ